MLSKEQNNLLTRTGAGTECGSLMRRYWQPAALVEELNIDRPVKAIKLMGEDLVLFRDESGDIGLVGRHCPHRGADLCFGRLEDGGLRCSFHGWLFDKAGKCLEQPAEPLESTYYAKIKHTAYPCVEINGVIFAFLGEGEPPELPNFDCFVAPDSHIFAFKGLVEANWLQLLEVGIDPAHASYLHRYFEDENPDEGYGQQFRDNTSGVDIPITKILREFGRPQIDFEDTEYGLKIFALRQFDDQNVHIRISNLLFPNAIVIPMSNDMVITQWHVPIDDVSSYWYAIFSSFSESVDKEAMRAQRLKLYSLPNYTSRLNRHNDWGFDPDTQKTKTYTGMGDDINVHDQWAVESPGPIFDRSKETLGISDKVIAKYRKVLREILGKNGDSGERSPFWPSADKFSSGGPLTVDTIAPSKDWQNHAAAFDKERRQASPWANGESTNLGPSSDE